MGFFSWNAAIEPGSKKQRAVMNAHTDECRPVWWYFPKHMDMAPLCEEAYDGYGGFGVSSYGELLYQMNEEHIAKKYGAAVLGALNHGLDDFGSKYYEDAAGRRWCLHNSLVLLAAVGAERFVGNYGTPQPEYNGATPNELIKSGVWVEKKLKLVKYPIKLAFFPNGTYETLPKSGHAKNQGFFA